MFVPKALNRATVPNELLFVMGLIWTNSMSVTRFPGAHDRLREWNLPDEFLNIARVC